MLKLKSHENVEIVNPLSHFWALPPEEILQSLKTHSEGLKAEEVNERLKIYGKNVLDSKKNLGTLQRLLAQFNTPIIYLLLFAATLALILYDEMDALIIFGIIIISALLSFFQENSAVNAIEKLLNIVKVKVNVLRENIELEIPQEELVPGDLLLLRGGDIIPCDCYLLESEGLQIDESSLTGETNPSEKNAEVIPKDTPLSKRSNSLFMGTHVISGSGKAIVVFTGNTTEFGKVSERLKKTPPENAFEKGVRHFGYFLLMVTSILITIILGFNIYLGRPWIESVLFSLALAVGLTPQLLPAIISINLAHGAKEMAKKNVIIKKLVSIENFGSMNIFCTDKTGTLTEGKLQLKSAVNLEGKDSDKVMLYAVINAYFQKSYKNPIDQTLLDAKHLDLTGWEKLDELPYDFKRKRISILAKKEGKQLMLSKGAVDKILQICSKVETPDGKEIEFASMKDQLETQFAHLSEEGNRVLGIAYKVVEKSHKLSLDDEKEMVFIGFLLFVDPLKKDAPQSIDNLKKLGISMRVITGDNKYAARYLAKKLNLPHEQIMTGPKLSKMSDKELEGKVQKICVFAEIEPNQKERIILALRNNHHIVGYLGDGINDVTALHAADVSISVDSAADVAKEVADIVLLKKNLQVLHDGVIAGRKTFANTLKYVFMATSANFGNMFSMAGASLFLSFLPLLPKQILLTNLMTDFPEMTIATDHVDKEMIDKPRRWNVRFIRNFMIIFGLISSIFDYITFGVLWSLNASETQFRTGWFIESVISASVIVLMIRTFKPFYKSRPSSYLLSTVCFIVAATLILPYTPLASFLGFQPLPGYFFFYITAILFGYILFVEIAKRLFNKFLV